MAYVLMREGVQILNILHYHKINIKLYKILLDIINHI